MTNTAGFANVLGLIHELIYNRQTVSQPILCLRPGLRGRGEGGKRNSTGQRTSNPLLYPLPGRRGRSRDLPKDDPTRMSGGPRHDEGLEGEKRVAFLEETVLNAIKVHLGGSCK